METLFIKAVQKIHGYASPPQLNYRVKLNQNENPADIPEQLKTDILKKAAGISWNRYPLNESPVLKEMLAQWHAVAQDQILLGNGSNQLLQTLMTATLEKGDKVVYFPPSFSLFNLFTPIYGGEPVEILQAPGQEFPKEKAFKAIIGEKPKLILLCSPNNPTGAELDIDLLREICAIAPGLVLWDEAYGEFAETTTVSILQDYPHLIISRTFSKAFSMAGLRLGYFIGDRRIIDQLRKVNLPYNVNLFTELVASEILKHREIMIERVSLLNKEREFLYKNMCRIKEITVFPSGANFILFRCKNGNHVFESLKSEGILVRNVCDYPLLRDHLRVTVGNRNENESFLNSLKKIII